MMANIDSRVVHPSALMRYSGAAGDIGALRNGVLKELHGGILEHVRDVHEALEPQRGEADRLRSRRDPERFVGEAGDTEALRNGVLADLRQGILTSTYTMLEQIRRVAQDAVEAEAQAEAERKAQAEFESAFMPWYFIDAPGPVCTFDSTFDDDLFDDQDERL